MPRRTRFDWLFRPQVADVDLPLSAEARFAEALAELPAVERSALALSEIGGLDTNEIAERLGTDPAIVRTLLDRARESVRITLAARGRGGIMALLPFQSVWQLGSSAPTMRAAGLVAAAVIAPTVAVGGAAADVPRSPVLRADPPAVRALESPLPGPAAAARVRTRPAVVATAVAVKHETVAEGKPRASRATARVERKQDAVPTAPAQSPRREEPRVPNPAQPAPAKQGAVARIIPLTVSAPLVLPAQLPVQLPVAVPALPLPEPLPAPELPKPPLLP